MSFISHVFLFLFTFILFHIQQGSCQKLPLYRDDYTYDAREKAFFKLHPEKRKWREAVFMCAGEGSQLDAPESKAQTRQLLSIITSDMQMIWLGINDIAKEGKFVTTNGSDAVFTDWASGQPNNKDGTEDCVVLSNNGRFISISCNAKQSYICKKHISTLTTNDECETHDLSYVYNQEADRCYKVHKVPRIWNNARKVCEAEKAHLGIINSRDEAIIFLENLNLHPKNTLMNSINKDAMHVGFREFSGVFKAINGKTLNESGFQEWNAGEPAELGVRRCGSMLRSGKLTTVACNVKGLFICEKPLGQNVVLNLDMRFGLEDEDEESVVVDENGEELYIFN